MGQGEHGKGKERENNVKHSKKTTPAKHAKKMTPASTAKKLTHEKHAKQEELPKKAIVQDKAATSVQKAGAQPILGNLEEPSAGTLANLLSPIKQGMSWFMR